jgi:hypothetical protein
LIHTNVQMKENNWELALQNHFNVLIVYITLVFINLKR